MPGDTHELLTSLRMAAGETPTAAVAGQAPGRAHFVDAEAEKTFHELMGRLTGKPGNEDHGDVGL